MVSFELMQGEIEVELTGSVLKNQNKVRGFRRKRHRRGHGAVLRQRWCYVELLYLNLQIKCLSSASGKASRK
ncbi:hypothetical protein CUJ88_04015 [Paraburkholderia hospita]|nr:hypothetical protein CUJ88_04015 [Paraburkholderia hospita]